jgi:hypothetical protein
MQAHKSRWPANRSLRSTIPHDTKTKGASLSDLPPSMLELKTAKRMQGCFY